MKIWTIPIEHTKSLNNLSFTVTYHPYRRSTRSGCLLKVALSELNLCSSPHSVCPAQQSHRRKLSWPAGTLFRESSGSRSKIRRSWVQGRAGLGGWLQVQLWRCHWLPCKPQGCFQQLPCGHHLLRIQPSICDSHLSCFNKSQKWLSHQNQRFQGQSAFVAKRRGYHWHKALVFSVETNIWRMEGQSSTSFSIYHVLCNLTTL